MSESIELVIYSKPECALCDEMKEVVETVRDNINISVKVKEIDITLDPELEKKYGLDIPLLYCGDIRLAKHRTNKKTLFNKIRKLTGGTAEGGDFL